MTVLAGVTVLGRPATAAAVFAAVLTACTATTATPPPAPTPPPVATTPLATATPATSPSPLASDSQSPTPTPQPEYGAFDAEAATAFATDLSFPRDAGTAGDLRARRRVAAALLGAGWQLVRQEVPLPQGGTTENLVAVTDPSVLEQPHVVLGGHLDTRDGSPGANDNASGIGVLVELARELRDEAEDLPLPIAIVAFGAEEFQPATPRLHHLGSQLYADRLGEHVVGAFVVDMVGNGDVTRLVWFDAGPDTMARRMAAVAEASGLAGYRVELRGDISDHGPFARRGIPAAFLWTGPDGRLHTPADTPEHLRVEDLRRAGDLALAFVRTLGPADVEGLRPAP